ncbi:MAG TPA: isoprenylcysteine carboxylmethyltransferase family protein [Pyrinomonadaceae bacterium]|nr:isoprenylcysteine carboxylmethyltransferase family protein [Pyrinomonadaceae bacterium]
MARRTGTKIQRWRVPLGFLFSAVFLLLARPEIWSLAAGGLIALVGLMIRAWASGHIRKNSVLAISGPYAHTRNPLYLGSFLLGLGFTIAAAHWWLPLVFAALFLGVYLPVMRAEAKELISLFGADYEKYAESVPLFLPRPTPFRTDGASEIKFDLKLYLRYREYQAALGLVAAWCLLLLKATLFH